MEEEFKHMVRISRRDVDGKKTIENALADIKGIGRALSRALCTVAGFDATHADRILTR